MNAPTNTGDNYIVHNMPIADYHASTALSNGGLSDLAQCPAMFWANRLNPNRPPEVEKESHLHGNLAHCAFFEPHEFDKRYVALPEDAPKKPTAAQWAAKKPSPESVAAMEWWKDYGKQHSGKRIITLEQATVAKLQAESLMALESVWGGLSMRKLFVMGKPEVSAFWKDPLTGVRCRARPDFVVQINERQCILIDGKTYSSAERSEVVRQIARMGYYRQAGHYTVGYHIASGLEVVAFIFAFVETQYPYLAGSYMLGEESLSEGLLQQRELVDLYADCLRTNKWPSYTASTQVVDLPPYVMSSKELEVAYAD